MPTLTLGDEQPPLPTCTSDMRNPNTSQRRSPPSSIANTRARSRCVRSAPSSASTSTGDNTLGSVRGVRINGTPRAPEASGRRAPTPRGTGLRRTSTSSRTSKYAKSPDTLANRRLSVRADNPDSPSSSRTTRAPRRGARCTARNSITSVVDTRAGSLPTTEKNTFRS